MIFDQHDERTQSNDIIQLHCKVHLSTTTSFMMSMSHCPPPALSWTMIHGALVIARNKWCVFICSQMNLESSSFAITHTAIATNNSRVICHVIPCDTNAHQHPAIKQRRLGQMKIRVSFIDVGTDIVCPFGRNYWIYCASIPSKLRRLQPDMRESCAALTHQQTTSNDNFGQRNRKLKAVSNVTPDGNILPIYVNEMGSGWLPRYGATIQTYVVYCVWRISEWHTIVIGPGSGRKHTNTLIKMNMQTENTWSTHEMNANKTLERWVRVVRRHRGASRKRQYKDRI